MDTWFSDVPWLHNGWTIFQKADERYRQILSRTLFPPDGYYRNKALRLWNKYKKMCKGLMLWIVPNYRLNPPNKIKEIQSFFSSVVDSIKVGKKNLSHIDPIEWPKHPFKCILWCCCILLPEIVWKKCIIVPIYYVMCAFVLATSWLVVFIFVPLCHLIWQLLKYTGFGLLTAYTLMAGVCLFGYFCLHFFGRYILVLLQCLGYSLMTFLFPIRLSIFGLAYGCCKINRVYTTFKAWLLKK